MSPGKSSRRRSRAERLQIPTRMLAVLEHQARRQYRRWRLDEAEHLARRVIRFEVGRPMAWFILGDIEMRRQRWQKAFGYFQQAIDCGQRDAMALCRGGEALLWGGELQRAAEWLHRSANWESTHENPGSRRAQSLLRRHSDKLAAYIRHLDGEADPEDGEQGLAGPDAPTQKLSRL